jgi:TMEM175 potassium channel family protein
VARETSAERLMLFSDAVLAIALTLLALELPIPDGKDNAEVLHSAYEYRWEYFTFLISFMVIATHWRAHHRPSARWRRSAAGSPR